MLKRLAVLLLFASLLTGCGSDNNSSTTLSYFIADAAQADVAARCATESGGAYAFDIQRLPNNAAGGREQLLRRLAAQDRSLDIVSVDPPFMAEFANAGFLRPFTDSEKQEFSAGVLKGPLEQSTFRNTLFSAPLYGNTQLLWYRKSVLQKAGVDPAAGPVTWDQLIKGASQAGVTFAAQGRRNESLMVWVNALIASAGGSILAPGSENLPADQVKTGLDSPAGTAAVTVMHDLAVSPAAPAGFSTAGEEDSRAAFQEANGGFMVNWPYVWAAFDAAIKEGSLPANFKDDVGWAAYPRVEAGRESAPRPAASGCRSARSATGRTSRCRRSAASPRSRARPSSWSARVTRPPCRRSSTTRRSGRCSRWPTRSARAWTPRPRARSAPTTATSPARSRPRSTRRTR
ncbi:extracellular solute-binding protein [Paractinoplanes durhamensis]|uniref:extracellular solute-binding protein n=1 Tax=Paractinoplanes durhamensis TaxID=113563 RepID=UPI003639BCA4